MSANNETVRKKHALLDWQNEKAYQEKRLKDPQSTVKEIEYAQKRIAEADLYIKQITEDINSEQDPERDDDFGVWMFEHGKGKEVAEKMEAYRKRIREEAAKKNK